MNFKEAIASIEARKESKINLGLDRLLHVLNGLGNPQEKLRVIHAAGTNAKGSVCKMLFSVLREAGYNAGFYSSPHLHSPRERIETVKGLISEKDFARGCERIFKTPGQKNLTYFEIMTALAFLYFAGKGCNAVILETGLGGRLDATNAPKKPALTIVTSIGMDHMEWLGTGLASIAAEKGGIFKAAVPALCGPMKPEAKKALKECAKRVGSSQISFLPSPLGGEGWVRGKVDWKKCRQSFLCNGQLYTLSMLGTHQIRNAQLVIEAVEILRDRGFEIPQKDLAAGLLKAHQSGRWELKFISGKPWVFDVGHNEQAVEVFLKTLKESPWARVKGKAALVGFFKDKDYRTMVRRLEQYFDQFFITPLDSDRAAEPKEILKAFKNRKKAEIVPSVKEGMAKLKGKSSSFNAVLGSFRLVAPALDTLS